MPDLVTASDFLDIYPDFSDFGVAQIEHYLNLSESSHCPAGTWRNEEARKQAILLRTAHYLEVRRLSFAYSAAMGVGIAQGSASIPSPPNPDDLSLTTYGVQFKGMQRRNPFRTGFVR